MSLLPHQVRVTQERIELNARLTLLAAFIDDSEVFRTLNDSEQSLLERQRQVMTEYLDILDQRIAAW